MYFYNSNNKIIKNRSPIEICFIATGDWAPFVTTVALSIVENTKEKVNFHVFTKNFGEKDIRIITDFLVGKRSGILIEFIDVKNNLKYCENVQLGWFKDNIPYARCLIPDLLDIPKAIYMDVDIIVNCDMNELWNIDLEEYPLAASKGWKDKCGIEHYHLSPEHLYFNNGLLILNCKKWREENIAKQMLHIARETKIRFRYPTQDLFNIFFDNNNYKPFDDSYNYQPAYSGKNFTPRIIHYTKDKPWEKENCFQGEYFWDYAKKTPYYSLLLQKMDDYKKQREELFRVFVANKRKLNNVN
ncbi:putative glycosyltransferase [Bacteroidia bacterium]|nr:putative glycosyltransferase [Bacteroidia bacterium]